MVDMEDVSRNVLQKVIIFVLIFTHQNNAQYVVDVMRMTSFGEEEVVHKCEATGGNFGKDVSDFITTDENLGCGVSVTPIDACGPIHISGNYSRNCHNLFAFVSRSDSAHPCKFSHQAFMVQNSTYSFRLVIFYNYPGLDPISMEGTELREKVNIPVIMVSHACKDDIVKLFPNLNGYRLRVRIDPGYYELFRYLIPFLVVIVFCFTLFIITLCVRGCVERRKMNKRRLSKRNLKKIPMKKYRLGDEPDTCAICLESFIPGEKLRHLPCKHVFHCNCIDVWLTQTRKVCPLCKRKIGSDSDSECSNDLFGEEQQRNVRERNDYQSPNEFTAAPTTQSLNMWSSQEALVHQDILLMGSTRRSITGFVRNAVRRMRRSNRYENEDNEVGLENNAYSTRQQATFFDNEHLLENDITTPVLAPVDTPNDLCSVNEETISVNSDATTLVTSSLPNTFQSC